MKIPLTLALATATAAQASSLVPDLIGVMKGTLSAQVKRDDPRDGGGRIREYALEYVNVKGEVFPAKLYLFTDMRGRVNEVSLLKLGFNRTGSTMSAADLQATGTLMGLITVAPVRCLGMSAGADMNELQKWLSARLNESTNTASQFRRVFKGVTVNIQTTASGMVELTMSGKPGSKFCTLEKY